MRKIIPLLLVFLCVLACKQNGNLKEEENALLETDRKFSSLSVEKGRAEAFLEYMTDDVTILPRQGHPIEGKESFKRLMMGEGQEEESVLKWEPYFVKISNSLDLGYTLGKYELSSMDAEGATQKAYGYYVTIWRRQPDGSWKFVYDAGNDSPPPKEK